MNNFTLSDEAVRQKRFVEKRESLLYKRTQTWLSPNQKKQLFSIQNITALNVQDSLAFCVEYTAKRVQFPKINYPLQQPPKSFQFTIFGWQIILRKQYEKK